MTSIVVLDSYPFAPTRFNILQQFGLVDIYDYTTIDTLLERSYNAELLVLNKTPLHRDIFDMLTRLQAVFLTSTGYDVVDSAYARILHIPIYNIPAYSTHSVAQHTFALLLALCNRIVQANDAVCDEQWQAPYFTIQMPALFELEGKILGIVGSGAIGMYVAKIAQSFGMHVIFSCKPDGSLPYNAHEDMYEYVSLIELARRSHIVSLHAPQNKHSYHMIDAHFFSQLARPIFLINTARGGLIDESALVAALNSGQVAGVALDVLENEPPYTRAQKQLIAHKRSIITPHIAWTGEHALDTLFLKLVQNVTHFLSQSTEKGNIINEI